VSSNPFSSSGESGELDFSCSAGRSLGRSINSVGLWLHQPLPLLPIDPPKARRRRRRRGKATMGTRLLCRDPRLAAAPGACARGPHLSYRLAGRALRQEPGGLKRG
jgi:hypothetical protein